MILPQSSPKESRAETGETIQLYSATAAHWIKKHGGAAVVILWVVISSVIHLYSVSIWYDEALTMLTVSGHAKPDFSLGMTQFEPEADLRKITFELYNQDVHPPLYFWTLAIWRVIFGSSLEVARSLSGLFVVGTCILLYRLACRSDMRWPWLPVAIYGLGAAGVEYAWNARPYAMASFLILFTHLLAQKRSKWAGICGAASIATHYFAALCVAPILMLKFIDEWKRDRTWVKQTAATFVIGVAPLLALLRIHLNARPHQYSDFSSWLEELWALLKGSVAAGLPNSGLPGWGLAFVVVAGFALAGIAWAWRHGKRFVPLMYLGFLCSFFVLALVTDKSIAKMPDTYYLGIAAPWLAMLVAYGVSTHPRWSPLLAITVFVGVVTAKPLVSSTNYRQLATRIKTECSECVVVVGNGYAGAVPASILYESGGMKVITANPGDTPQTIAKRAGDQQPVMFVKTNEPPTIRIEDEFVNTYPSVWRGGYFEVFTQGTPMLRIDSDQANRTAAPNPLETARSRH